jgi:choline dehydrogenase
LALACATGLLTIGAGYAGGFFRANAEAMTPDVQVHFIIFSADTAGATLHPFPGFIASVCQLRPQSRGFVRIKSADPREPPAIQPRYLSRPYDCDTVIAGMKLLRRIMTQPAMRHYIAEERAPDPRCTSDADLLAFARENGTTVFHPTSTCRMGSDAAAVVDERLRVRGIERLRVVDGSIMPTVERHASGEIDWTGRILKCGDAMLRSYLFEAAGVLLTRVPKWSALKAWGMRLAKPDCCQKPSSHSQKIPLPAPQPETVELDLVNPLRSGRRA